MNDGHGIGRYLNRIHRLQLKYMKPIFEKSDISPSCFTIILNLHYHPGISQKQLCDITKHDEAIATRLIKGMEKNGFVQKMRNPLDHRAFQLYLTDKGEALYPQIQTKLDEWWKQILDGMPVDILNQSLALMTERANTLANKEKEEANHE